MYSDTLVNSGQMVKEPYGIIRVTITIFYYFCLVLMHAACTASPVAPCSLSHPSPKSMHPALVCCDPSGHGCVPYPQVSPILLWHTDGFRALFRHRSGTSCSASLLFLLPHIFQYLECVDIECGDTKEPRPLIELFLLHKLNFQPPQNLRTCLCEGLGPKMCV